MRPLPWTRCLHCRSIRFVLFVLATSLFASPASSQQFGQQFLRQFDQFRQQLARQFTQQFLQPSRQQVRDPLDQRFDQQFGEPFGQQREFRDGAKVSFQQQLETGLYARRPEEFAFIDRVVTMVNQNQLSRDLVTSTFLWAQKRDNQRRAMSDKRPYPFVYFERGLKVRASRLGITVQ